MEAYSSALSCTALPLRTVDEPPTAADVYALLGRAFDVTASVHAAAVEGATTRRHAALAVDLALRKSWAQTGKHPVYTQGSFHDPEHWSGWREVELSVCNRLRRRNALSSTFSGGTVMIAVQDLHCSLDDHQRLRVRAQCEGHTKDTPAIALGAHGEHGPMLGLPITRANSMLTLEVCADDSSTNAVASTVPIPVSDVCSSAGDGATDTEDHDIWCPLLLVRSTSMFRSMRKGLARSTSGDGGHSSSGASETKVGRIHLKLSFVDGCVSTTYRARLCTVVSRVLPFVLQRCVCCACAARLVARKPPSRDLWPVAARPPTRPGRKTRSSI